MKGKKLLVLVIGLLFLLSMNSYAETKQLKDIGRYTLVRIKGEVPSPEVMKILVEKYAGDIKYGFDTAGYGDIYFAFMDQIKNANFVEKEIPIGGKFMWMLFRSHGKVKVVEDLEWAGKAPLPVYSFIVTKGFKHYEIIMPRPCGNISLINVEEVIPAAVCDLKVSPAKANIGDPISVDMSGTQNAKSMEVVIMDANGKEISKKTLTPDNARWQTKFETPGEYAFKASAMNLEEILSVNPCTAKTYINYPPICKLWTSCLPCQDSVGKPITIDASNSTDPDGEVVKADFEIRDEEGNIVDTFSDGETPFTWEKIFNTAGIYTITGVVTDDFGAVSEPQSIEIEVTWKRFFWLVDGGTLFARGSHGHYLAGRLGFQYKLIPNALSLIVEAGPSFSLQSEPWRHFFMGNALLNFHAGAVYFGAGAGYASKVKTDREGDFVLIANLGFNLFDNYTNAGSIFFEGHGPVGKDRSFSKHHKLFFGFRFIF